MLVTNIGSFIRELNRKTIAGNQWHLITIADKKTLSKLDVEEIFSQIFRYAEKFCFKILIEVNHLWRNLDKEDWRRLLNLLENEQEIRTFILFLSFVINIDGIVFFQNYWKGEKVTKKRVMKNFKMQSNILCERDYFRDIYEISDIYFEDVKQELEK